MKLLGMNVLPKAVNDGKWLTTHYKSLSAFTKYLEKNEGTETNHFSSHTGSFDFTQTNSFEETIQLLKTGSDEIKAGLKDAVKHAIADLQKELNSQPEGYMPDVEGLFFDVAKVVEGEPECWYREPWDKVKKPRISVPIMGTYNGGFDSKRAIDNASKVIALIKAMEDKGIEVEMTMCFLTSRMTDDNYHGMTAVTVKGYDERFNWSKLSAMLHPSFFRRMIFRDSELQAPKTLSSGYGTDYNPKDVFEGGENMIKISDVDSINRFKTKVLETLKGKKK